MKKLKRMMRLYVKSKFPKRYTKSSLILLFKKNLHITIKNIIEETFI